MEKAEKVTKRRAPDAGVEGLSQRKKLREVEEAEVEEFFATLRRMRGAMKYFEMSSVDGARRGPALWRAVLETGADLSVKGRLLKATPEEEPKREGAGVVPDLNASPEESSARN